MLPSKLEVNNSAIIVVHNEAGSKQGRRERKDVHFPFDLNNASKVASFAAERGAWHMFPFPRGQSYREAEVARGDPLQLLCVRISYRARRPRIACYRAMQGGHIRSQQLLPAIPRYRYRLLTG